MSEIVNTTARSIGTVTAEIRTITRQTQQIVLTAAIEIGRRLVEAKAMVPHGEWGQYLKQEVEFSQSTAQNFMRLFEEYGDQQDSLFAPKSQALENLSYTKALRLLALPAEERAEFVEENHVEGMSTRELEQALKELDEAKQREAEAREAAAESDRVYGLVQKDLDNANAQKDMLRLKADEAEEKASKALQASAHLRQQLEKAQKDLTAALTRKPEIPEDQMEQIRQEAEALAAMEATAKAKRDVERAEKKAEEARKEAEAARAALEKAKTAQKTADANVAVFKSLYEQVQQDFNRMNGSLKKVELDRPEVAGNLRNAVKAMLEKFGREIGV